MKVKIIRRNIPPTKVCDLGLGSRLNQVFTSRGIKDKLELSLGLKHLVPISSLGQVAQGAELLYRHISKNHKILVIADFDADGATACAVLLKALRRLKAKIDFVVPNRLQHGYGFSQKLAEEVISQKPDLIITVDNGISSINGIALVRQNNIDVIVTDHHLPADTLPQANVIINPNSPGENFASKNLCGVGVAFYLVCALHKQLENSNRYQEQNLFPLNPADFLDLVALGTIADVVKLDQNNRILVNAGLKQIRNDNSCTGIKALFKITEIDPAYAEAQDIAFKIAPRINAAGRMEDMRIGIECLMSDDETRAIKLAAMLNEINLKRQQTQADMQQAAQKIVDRVQQNSSLPLGLCLYHQSWHEGIVGIVAGRLKDKFHRPAIVFALSGDTLKGSARSIAKLNIRDTLDLVDKQNPGLINRFGGHAMAAGLSIGQDKFDEFACAFDKVVSRQINASELSAEIHSDGELKEHEFTLEFVSKIKNITPWGQGFSEPVFDGEFEVLEQRVVGQKHLKMILRAKNSKIPLDAIAFNQKPCKRNIIRIAYRLDINRWRDNIALQLMVLHIE